MTSAATAFPEAIIRPYEQGDQAAVVELLARSLPHDRIDAAIFADRILDDPDFDPRLNLVGVAGGQVAGFVAGAPANERLQCPAGVKLFAVTPGFRRRGLATRLFDAVEAELRHRGASRSIAIAAGNNRLAQGLDVRYTGALCFLLTRGYERTGVTQDMSVDLATADLDTAALEAACARAGVRIRRATAADRDWVQAGVERELAFPTPGDPRGRRWAYLALQGLRRDPPSLHVAEDATTGAFLGFAVNHAARWGALGPMGVAEHARGHGLGAILLKRCLRDLRDEGYAQAEIFSVGPIPFYAKTVGATISRVLYQLAKALNPSVPSSASGADGATAPPAPHLPPESP